MTDDIIIVIIAFLAGVAVHFKKYDQAVFTILLFFSILAKMS